MTDDAKDYIATLSEGYPHFLQELAYHAYEEDRDHTVDLTDVINSLFKEHGAFDQLGRKYFDQFYTAPSSDDYRLVLKTMAKHLDRWIQRADIIAESGLKQGTVDNALRALKAKTIVLQNEMKSGQYRLPTQSFAVWINAREVAEKSAERLDRPSLF